MNTILSIVAGALATSMLAGLGFAWLLHRANRVGGSDHDYGMRG
mgnify:CR=1 FL=1